MNFFEEQQSRIDRLRNGAGVLAYEKHCLLRNQEATQMRIEIIDDLIGEMEASVKQIEQSKADFETYLAVKEGAVTLDQVMSGIQEASKNDE
jgi:hypothetical protein